jgi:hypothetical protein
VEVVETNGPTAALVHKRLALAEQLATDFLEEEAAKHGQEQAAVAQAAPVKAQAELCAIRILGKEIYQAANLL